MQLRAHSIDDADLSSPDRSTSQTMRASTGTLPTVDKLSEQELKKLNERVMSWRIYIPPGKNNTQNSQNTSTNNSNQVKSKLHSLPIETGRDDSKTLIINPFLFH